MPLLEAISVLGKTSFEAAYHVILAKVGKSGAMGIKPMNNRNFYQRWPGTKR
ncbi:MAG TPA: hypothetical protein VLH15_02880 [Dehalococcoidales bacterium]|nr:hypothetical protein [Dehalococcoidales bacterium]